VLRRATQAVSALALNPFLPNFLRGRIHTGALKHVCVPALNCYSCPAAFGACPIGSLQVCLSYVRGYFQAGAGALEVEQGARAAASAASAAGHADAASVAASAGETVASTGTGAGGAGDPAGAAAAARLVDAASAWALLYVAGVVMLVGAVGGRFACGWICPFGLLQELIWRPRRARPLPAGARFGKYGVLVVFVVLLPLVLAYPASPPFCKWICPAGTIEAGVPLVGHDKLTGGVSLPVGLLFAWKMLLALAILAASLVISRFFCRAICPLGALWGLFNRVSLFALRVDSQACTRCGFCRGVCPVDISVFEDANSPECIRCLRCLECPEGAVKLVFRPRAVDSKVGAEGAGPESASGSAP